MKYNIQWLCSRMHCAVGDGQAGWLLYEKNAVLFVLETVALHCLLSISSPV